jgi:hypothetical protein
MQKAVKVFQGGPQRFRMALITTGGVCQRFPQVETLLQAVSEGELIGSYLQLCGVPHSVGRPENGFAGASATGRFRLLAELSGMALRNADWIGTARKIKFKLALEQAYNPAASRGYRPGLRFIEEYLRHNRLAPGSGWKSLASERAENSPLSSDLGQF